MIRTWRDIPSDTPHRVGGTTAAALLGLCPPTWRGSSPWGLWRAARGLPAEQPDAEVLARGRACEPAILAAYTARTGHALTGAGSILVDPREPWRVGTVDALCGSLVVEGKSHLSPDGYAPDGTTTTHYDEDAPPCPAHEWVQACWYISLVPGCIGCDLAVMLPDPAQWDPLARKAALAALSTTREAAHALVDAWYDAGSTVLPASGVLRIIHLRPSPEEVAAVVDAVREARERILIRGEEPPPDASDDCRRDLVSRPREGRPRRATGDEADLVSRIRTLRETADLANERSRTLTAALLSRMTARKIHLDDGSAVTITATGQVRGL